MIPICLVAQRGSETTPNQSTRGGPAAKPNDQVEIVLELRSDPLGSQFGSYLDRALTALKNAARDSASGKPMEGIVELEFSVARSGRITKLVFVRASGSAAPDQAATTAVSLVNPLPSLPEDCRTAGALRRLFGQDFIFTIRRFTMSAKCPDGETQKLAAGPSSAMGGKVPSIYRPSAAENPFAQAAG
jgi:TonB family protein